MKPVSDKIVEKISTQFSWYIHFVYEDHEVLRDNFKNRAERNFIKHNMKKEGWACMMSG
jgi:hypothetical protein